MARSKKGKVLYVRNDGTKAYELDYARYLIKHNPEYKEERYINGFKNKNKKLLGAHNIPFSIWKRAYKLELGVEI